jgi:hypothetical protein
MSHLLRCGLVAAGLVLAFAAGFYLKPVPTVPTVAAQPAPAPVVAPPNIDPDVKPATALGQPPPARRELDPLDAAGMAMIRRELGHKTTVLDKSEPLPAVLADAQKTLPSIEPPTPMGGPMPRLDPPPMPAMPTVPDIVPPPPATTAAVKLVNTRAIALDFEMTKTGSSPVTATELWTTRDGGSIWAKTDCMAGCQSPFRTQLGSEGMYGFRLVFESESGMRSAEPRRGDKPDLRVELDTTPPRIAISPPFAGEARKVRFRWQMIDPHLDWGYVRLEYSTDGRAWHPINSGDKPESGDPTSFAWTPPPGLPPRVLIRISGRDTAGNYATVTMSEKVSIDLVPPAGKVTGVRSGEIEVGPMPREVKAVSTLPLRATIAAPLPGLLGSPVLLR